MSDHCPPETPMHINDLSEECLRSVFVPMSLVQQLNAGQVCKLWRKVQTSLCHTKQSLIVVLYKYDYDHMPWWLLRHLKNRDYNGTGLNTTELNEERVASLVQLFPNVSEITVLSEGVDTLEAQMAMLLTQFQKQLITFNLKADLLPRFGEKRDRSTAAAPFIDAINAMQQLKHLSLCFDNTVKFQPFDMPLLTQLDSFKFKCPSIPISILKLWMPHLKSRSEPLSISFVGGATSIILSNNDTCDVKHFLPFTTKVALIFTKLPNINCNLDQLRRMSMRFTNLTHLELDDFGKASYSASIPALLRTLSAFKKLTNLTIHTCFHNELDPVPSSVQLPQLSSVKKWTLEIRHVASHYCYGTYSHANLNYWTQNIGWVFPNLERLLVCFNNYHACSDCPFDVFIDYDEDTFERDLEVKTALAKACLIKQLRPIKHQLPKLNKADIYCEDMSVCVDSATVDAHCTLEDITD